MGEVCAEHGPGEELSDRVRDGLVRGLSGHGSREGEATGESQRQDAGADAPDGGATFVRVLREHDVAFLIQTDDRKRVGVDPSADAAALPLRPHGLDGGCSGEQELRRTNGAADPAFVARIRLWVVRDAKGW
jgi:hypothetical protein